MKPTRRKPRDSPSFKLYTSLIEQHKKIYYASGRSERYEQRYWVDNDVSWRELDSYTKKAILKALEAKIANKEL